MVEILASKRAMDIVSGDILLWHTNAGNFIMVIGVDVSKSTTSIMSIDASGMIEKMIVANMTKLTISC